MDVLFPVMNWGMDPGFTMAAAGPGWYPIDFGEGVDGLLYGQYVLEFDAEDGAYERFYTLPEPDVLAGESSIIRGLVERGGFPMPTPALRYADITTYNRMREIEAYLSYAQNLTGYAVDWREAIARAWWLQLAQFGPWSTFDDAGQTALKIIAQSGLPNAQALAEAIRQTASFQAGQAAMARAWDESNKASNLLTLVTEIVGDIGTLASSGGFKLIMLPFAVMGAINLANSLAQYGLTETIRQTAQGAADRLSNALSFAQSADAATVAAEQFAAEQAAQLAAEQAAQEATRQAAEQFAAEQAAQLAAEQAAQYAAQLAAEQAAQLAAEQAAQYAAQLAAEQAAQALPDIFLEVDIGMAEALANPVLPIELFLPQTPLPDIDIFAEGDAGMAEAFANPILPPELQAPSVEPPQVDSPQTVFDETDAGMTEALESGGTLPADFVPATPYVPAASLTTGAGVTSALTQAAAAVKAGAGLLAVAMGAGGSATPRPNQLQPGQIVSTTGQSQNPFAGATAASMLLPVAVVALALFAAKRKQT